MKCALKIVGTISALVILLIGGIWWKIHLPSDKRALAYFRAHERDFNALVSMINRQPADMLDVHLSALGIQQEDPEYAGITRLLKDAGVKFFRRNQSRNGVVEFYLWGIG